MFETLIANLIKKGSDSILILAFSGVTIATSGVAGAKLYKTIQAPSNPTVAELPTAAEVLGVTSQNTIEVPTTVQNQNTTPEVQNNPVSNDLIANNFPTATPIVPTQQNNTQSQTETTSGCIIKVFEKNYDITSFRNTHPGGDVFICGTDMSATYTKAHGTNVASLAKYATTALLSSSSITQTNSQNGNTIGSFENEEEHEDEEEHDEEDRHFEDDDHDEDEDEEENEIEHDDD